MEHAARIAYGAPKVAAHLHAKANYAHVDFFVRRCAGEHVLCYEKRRREGGERPGLFDEASPVYIKIFHK